MKYRNVGASGLQVSVIGVGCNNFGLRTSVADSRLVVDKAIDMGITLFDTADIYSDRGGSERALGEILGSKRDRIVLATKFCGPMDDTGWLKGGSRRYIMSAVDASLTRLKTDYIDLYQMHYPDPRTPIAETLGALDDLITAGKVRYIGCSNYAGWQLADAQWTAKVNGTNAFVSAQDEWSLLVRDIERDPVPAVEAFNVGMLPYFPLASGFLSGKYKRGVPLPEGSRMARFKRFAERFMTEANWDIVDGLTAFSEERGHTLLELAFSWLLAHRCVSSVIAGATKPDQIEANVGAAGWLLTPDEMDQIDTICGWVKPTPKG